MEFGKRIKGFGVVPAAMGFLVLAVAGYFFAGHPRDQGTDELSAESVVFEVVDAAHRELDGSPALAISFSLPLDAKGDYEKFVQVLEMPGATQTHKATSPNHDEEADEDENPRLAKRLASGTSRFAADTALEGGKPVSGAWIVGENPRLLFFPHIKPQTRYVVRVQAGLPANSGSKLLEESRLSIQTAAVAPAFYFASRGMVLPATQNGGLPVTTVNVPEVDIQFLKVKSEQLSNFLEKARGGQGELIWLANGRQLGRGVAGRSLVRSFAEAGRYQITVMDANGRYDRVEISVR